MTGDGGQTGWAVQSLTTPHGAVLAAGQQGRGEAGGHGPSTNTPITNTNTRKEKRKDVGRAVRMWTWTWTWTWTRVRAEWAEEGAGVEPTDTGRWGPGAL